MPSQTNPEIGLQNTTYSRNNFDTSMEWMEFVLSLLGNVYEITGQDSDDIDRVQRQQEIQEILDLIKAIESGDASVEDLANYELDFLKDVEGAQEWLDSVVSGYGTTEETTNVLTNPNAEQLRNILIQEGYSPEDAQEYVSNAFYDLSGRGAVTLEGILNRAGYYVENGILQLPNAYGADTNGDGVIDTAVVLRGGEEVPVYGAADVEAQIQAEQDKYNQVIGQEGWDNLEDWEKNRILENAGYNPIHGDGTTDNPELDRAIADIYQDILDRDPDAEGDSYWTDIWESGSVTDQDEDGDVDYDDLRVLIEQAAQPELEQRDQETQDLISTIKDKFPTWEDLWSEVQSQLPSNPQEWGDVIRSVIEATGIDLPDGDIYGILNGGYGVTWNPGGIAGLPSGVGAILQSGLIFVPGIPVGLPPSSTIIGSIGDLINAENPIDVLIQRAQDVFGNIVNNPSDLINTIITDELELPENIWDILIGGAAVTQEVLDWLSENGFSSEGEDTTAPPLGGDDEEEDEDTSAQDGGVSFGPDNPRPDDALYQEVTQDQTDGKDQTNYTELDSSIGEEETDIPTLIDDTLLGEGENEEDSNDLDILQDTTADNTIDNDDVTVIIDPIRETTDDKEVTDYDTVFEQEPEIPTLPDETDFGNTGDSGGNNTTLVEDDGTILIQDPIRDTTDGKEVTDYNTIVEPEPEIPTLGPPDPPPNNEDFVEDTVLIEDPIREITDDKTITNYNDFPELEPEIPTLGPPDPPPYDDFIDDGGGGGGGSIGGSSDPSRFRKGLTYQVFDPQPIIAPSQIDFSRGLFGGSSSQINQKEPSVVATLFGDYYDLSRFS